MKTIKIRAWNKKLQQWGNLNQISDWGSCELTWNIGFGNKEYPFETFTLKEDDNYILMQFTGLLDKNNKEIYEGDIITISDICDAKTYIAEVIFKNSAFRYVHTDGSMSVLPRTTKKVKGYESITYDVKVIGNIYENK